MTKTEFLNLMEFPSEWSSLGFYRDELFKIQVAEYTPGAEAANEHFRMGAYRWWEVNFSEKAELETLLKLVNQDPDHGLAEYAEERLRKIIATLS